MSAALLPLPDSIADWALAATPRPDGAVDLVFSLSGPAGATAVCLLLSREEAREHARAVLRAAGDGGERTHRLVRLCDEDWNRVCIGSTAEFATVLSGPWCRRMDEAWNELARVFGRTPPIHMLRGMQTLGRRWPFASVDSTDVAQNHNRPQNTARAMADRWDAMQCPGRWEPRPEQLELCA